VDRKTKQGSGLSVVCLDHAPCRRDVQHAVDDKRRRFLAAVGVEVGVPGEAKLLHVVGADLGQRTVALFAIRPAVCQPVGGILVGLDNPVCVHIRGWSCGTGRFCAGHSDGK